MLFEIDEAAKRLRKHTSFWAIGELELEDYLKTSDVQGNPNQLDPEVFGEELFFVKNQSRTRQGKRLDILALDRRGNGTVIELKKDRGKLGVETQALQYVADVAKYRGHAFLSNYKISGARDDVLAFLDEGVRIEDINKNTRMILMARYFDDGLLSMGHWLAENNVAFRCISFAPIVVEGRKYLSFSVVFDQTAASTRHSADFSAEQREPRAFWHNIGSSDESWWLHLLDNGEISANWDNEPGDRGETVLTSYIKDDVVFAYASGIGCVGYATVGSTGASGYELVDAGSIKDVFPQSGQHLHRKGVNWRAATRDFRKAIPVSELRNKFNITHPVQTSSAIRTGDTERLKRALDERSDL
jgi:hypothetical protein